MEGTIVVDELSSYFQIQGERVVLSLVLRWRAILQVCYDMRASSYTLAVIWSTPLDTKASVPVFILLRKVAVSFFFFFVRSFRVIDRVSL